MKLVRWARFSWDLTRLAPVYPAIDSHYHIRPATADDEKAVRTVILSAFTLDPNWAFLLRDLRGQIEASLNHAFGEKRDRDKRDKRDQNEPACVVLTHGSRIIGASTLTFDPDADSHLLSGPCVLMEYRNRGLATALLAQSLTTLRDANLTIAHGLTRLNSLTAECIYTKFNSSGPHEMKPDLAAG